MPALRLPNRRRKSSHNISYTPAKPGIYGVPTRPAPGVTFAPNVTPVSYTLPDPDDDPANPLASLASPEEDDAAGPHVKALRAQIYPASASEAATAGGGPQKRKRTPPGKRPSQGYIPRPPNAFMLFRAAFVKQRHVPGSIETNHGSLSKIIGTCWRQLPLDEKRTWEKRAKEEKAAHKVRFPDYRFRPVHNRNKVSPSSASANGNAKTSAMPNVKKEKQPTTAEEEQRCEDISQLILEGKCGDELEAAIRDLDRARMMERMQMQNQGMGVHDEYEFEDAESSSRRTSVDFGNGSRHASPGALHLPYSGNHPSQGLSYPRRSSSVPLPNDWFATSGPFLGSSKQAQTGGSGIALPTLPSLASLSRPVSPVGSISRFGHGHHHSHSLSQNLHGQGHGFQAEHFTNPFQSQQHQEPQRNFTFPPISVTPQQGLFHPSPQQPQSFIHTQTSQRSSLGLGLGLNQRRASSAQAMLMRSWTMPLPLTGDMNMGMGMGMNTGMNMDGFEYRMSMDMDMDMGLGMGIDYPMQMEMERDPSPLPDVDPGLFADFSFGKCDASNSSAASPSPSISSAASAPVPPTLAPIDTSISISPLARPDSRSRTLADADSACPTSSISASTSTSVSGSPSPAPSISDVLPEMSNIGMGPLDGLYAPDPMNMGDYPSGYMGMSMYAYDIDPVVSSQHQDDHSPKLLNLKTPTATATEANFAELGRGADDDAAAYFESA